MTVYKKSTISRNIKYESVNVGSYKTDDTWSTRKLAETKIVLNPDGTITWDTEDGLTVSRSPDGNENKYLIYKGTGSDVIFITRHYYAYYNVMEYKNNGTEIKPKDFIEYISTDETYPQDGYTVDENGEPDYYYEEVKPLYVIKCDDEYYKIDNGELTLINDKFEENEECFIKYGSISYKINKFDQLKKDNKQTAELIKWLPIEDPYNNKAILNVYNNYDEMNKRYKGSGRLIIPLEEIDENAKKCHVQLQGKNFYIKTSLYNDQHYTYAMPYTTLGDQYIMDIDMTTAPLTTTHIPTKDNPFCLLIDISSDGYLEAYSYSWY